MDPTLRRIMHYDEDMHLVAETELTSAWQRAIAYEYVVLGDQPVAQRDLGGTPTTTWLVGDHLGTPFLQTASTGAVLWRVEAEPYGRVWALRTGSDRHQPLRFPGQEAEQLNLGLNGATERSYNIFRWYRPKWGRYSQADPIERHFRVKSNQPGIKGLRSEGSLWKADWGGFAYAEGSPTRMTDPTGLAVWVCTRVTDWGVGRHAYFWDDRQYLPPGRPRFCGTTASSGRGRGTDHPERGPGKSKDPCFRIDGSEGKEDALMGCCMATANTGPYIPFTPLDCHGHLQGCTEAFGLHFPGGPGGRL